MTLDKVIEKNHLKILTLLVLLSIGLSANQDKEAKKQDIEKKEKI